MRSATNKLVITTVLAVVLACLAQEERADVPDGAYLEGEELSICQDGKCIKKQDVSYSGLFRSEEEMKKIADGEGVAVGDEPADSFCPHSFWHRCCDTCHHYRILPYNITVNGEVCHVVHLNNSYQFVFWGHCRNPGMACGYGWCRWHRCQRRWCQQRYGLQPVLCWRGTWPDITVIWERFRYPAYCSCDPRRALEEAVPDRDSPE